VHAPPGADDWRWLELGRVLRAIAERHAADLRGRIDGEQGRKPASGAVGAAAPGAAPRNAAR
jgi:hypothetical protein